MTNDELRSELLKLAAACIRGDMMPPEFVDDWDLPRSTPIRARNEIKKHMAQTRLVANGWGRRLKQLADNLKEQR
jgi:hypothetical protein